MNKQQLQKQHNHNAISIEQHSTEVFSGPLPHPDILKKFNEIVPGSAERIIKMAEEQSTHRRELEKKVINSDISQSKRGQILGFIISITGLLVSAFVAVYGSAIAGGIIGIGTLASLVSVFMYGSKTRSEEREEGKGK
jgi:uncharacterized membrane protein